jgi:hypothetical protein
MRNRTDRPSARALARAVTPLSRPRALRLLICALVLGAVAVAPGLAGGDAPAAKLDVVPDGNGTVTVSPAPSDGGPCAGSADDLLDCTYDVAPSADVTLTATTPEGSGSTFVGWSDARCPGTGSCTLRIDSDWQSVTALFSPQRVKVKATGPGNVTKPSGDECPAVKEGQRQFLDCGRVPILSQITLRANPNDPTVVPMWEPSLCEPPAPKKGDTLCTLNVLGPTLGKVGFNDEPGGDVKPTIRVTFRVLKQGSGRGTVRSQSLDCGTRCTIDGHFGDRETLVADPAPGSTFTR